MSLSHRVHFKMTFPQLVEPWKIWLTRALGEQSPDSAFAVEQTEELLSLLRRAVGRERGIVAVFGI